MLPDSTVPLAKVCPCKQLTELSKAGAGMHKSESRNRGRMVGKAAPAKLIQSKMRCVASGDYLLEMRASVTGTASCAERHTDLVY